MGARAFFLSSLVAATSCLLAPLCVWRYVWLERALERKLINKQIQISSTMKTSSDGKNKGRLLVQPVRKTHVTVNESNFARR